jgi:hypothetical protein
MLLIIGITKTIYLQVYLYTQKHAFIGIRYGRNTLASDTYVFMSRLYAIFKSNNVYIYTYALIYTIFKYMNSYKYSNI